jgi:hypothetical protein
VTSPNPNGVQVDPMLVIRRLSEKLAEREQELALAEVIIAQLQADAAE